MNDIELTSEQLAAINAPVSAPVAAPAASDPATASEKKTRLRPAVQNRRANVNAVISQILSDGVPRGVSELTRLAEGFGLASHSLWVDIYNALKTDGRFASRQVGTAKRPKFYLVEGAQVSAPVASAQKSTVPEDGGFASIESADDDLRELMAA